jgi:hypothetical protein
MATGIKPDVPAVDAVTSANFVVGAYAMARRVLLSLWPHVRPIPKEMRGVSLKHLARVFCSLRKDKDESEVVMSKQQRTMLHQKLNRLIGEWTKLSSRRFNRALKSRFIMYHELVRDLDYLLFFF